MNVSHGWKISPAGARKRRKTTVKIRRNPLLFFLPLIRESYFQRIKESILDVEKLLLNFLKAFVLLKIYFLFLHILFFEVMTIQ